MKLLHLLPLAALLPACSLGPWPAPPGATIEMIEDDITVPWFPCTDVIPDCVESQFLIHTSVRVEDELGDPLNNVEVAFTSMWQDVFFVPQSVIQAVDYPSTSSWAAIESSGDVYAELTGEFDGDYRPTYFETATDRNGRSEVWIWVESLPINLSQAGQAGGGGGAAVLQPIGVSILVDIGADSRALELSAGAN